MGGKTTPLGPSLLTQKLDVRYGTGTGTVPEAAGPAGRLAFLAPAVVPPPRRLEAPPAKGRRRVLAVKNKTEGHIGTTAKNA